jgi:hypothetical protein
MADTQKQQGQLIGNGAAEVVRRGAAAAHTVVEAAQQATAAGTEAVQRAQAEVFRKAAETASQGATTTEGAQRTTQSLWVAGQHLWGMQPGRAAMPDNMTEMPQAFAGVFGDMLRANLRIGQELFRLANPTTLIEMQQKLVRSYLDAFVSSQSMLLGLARRTAENAQRRAD